MPANGQLTVEPAGSMLPPPASGSHNGETSPDQSSCSSDTGDVLIRSTRVLLSDRRHGPGPGSVQITVQKLRDPPVQPPLAEQQQQSSGTEKQQQRPKPRQKPGESSGRCPRSSGDLSCVVTERGRHEAGKPTRHIMTCN